MSRACQGCSHPTICKTHGCAAWEAQRNQSPVATDADSVRRELMAMARRDGISDRDRIVLGAAIGLIRADSK